MQELVLGLDLPDVAVELLGPSRFGALVALQRGPRLPASARGARGSMAAVAMGDARGLSGRPSARVGELLEGKWRLDALLGVGAMAAVYQATHRNGNRVAIKLLHPALCSNEEVRARFLREGYVANKVEHKGAVAVQDDGVTGDGSAFLVMELLEGETLEARRKRKGGKLAPAEVLSAVDQLLGTLAAAHERGIVHRDIKPENVFLTRDGSVKVLDFGIARLRELSAAGSLTMIGSLLGSPAFMPPEQARGRHDELDARSDVWAVGATMFTLLTGKYVHPTETASEALAMAATQPARSIAALEPGLGPELGELVDKALRFHQAERWPDARSMQEALRRAHRATSGELIPPPARLSIPEDAVGDTLTAAAEPRAEPGARALPAGFQQRGVESTLERTQPLASHLGADDSVRTQALPSGPGRSGAAFGLQGLAQAPSDAALPQATGAGVAASLARAPRRVPPKLAMVIGAAVAALAVAAAAAGLLVAGQGRKPAGAGAAAPAGSSSAQPSATAPAEPAGTQEASSTEQGGAEPEGESAAGAELPAERAAARQPPAGGRGDERPAAEKPGDGGKKPGAPLEPAGSAQARAPGPSPASAQPSPSAPGVDPYSIRR
ncbi:MAG: protein kinase [Deltaproteobacteria bacterium]|nr:protein kinase [Deltaproteobacteria bacterium]